MNGPGPGRRPEAGRLVTDVRRPPATPVRAAGRARGLGGIEAVVGVVLASAAAGILGLGLAGVATRGSVLGLITCYVLVAALSDRFALYGFVALLGAQFYFPVGRGITVAFTEVLATAFVGVVLARRLVRGRVAVPSTMLGALAMLYALGNILYLLNSTFQADAIRLFGRGALLAATFWATRSVLLRESAFRPLLLRLIPLALVSIAVQFVLAAVFRGPDRLPLYVLYVQAASATGVFPPIREDVITTMLIYPEARPGSFLDPFGGGYSIYLLAILPVFILLALESSRGNRLVGWIAATACAVALALTQARTGVYAAVGGMLIMGVITKRRLKMAALLGTVGLVVAITAGDYLVARLLSRTESAIVSAQGRFRDYVPASIGNGLRNPALGSGLRAFDKSRGGVLPHNQFLSDFQGRGLSGLLLGLLMFGVAAAVAWPLRRYRLPVDEQFAYRWSVVVIGSYFLACFATTPLDYLQLACPLFVAFAVLDVIALRRFATVRLRT